MLGEKTFLYFCQSDYVHRRTSLDSSSIFCHGGGGCLHSAINFTYPTNCPFGQKARGAGGQLGGGWWAAGGRPVGGPPPPKELSFFGWVFLAAAMNI